MVQLEKSRRLSWRRVLLALVILPILFLVFLVPFRVGDYYDFLDNYSGQVVRDDNLAAKEGLNNLKYFYDLNTKLKPFKLDYFGNKLLFRDVRQHQASFDYLTGRHDKVVEDLKNDNNFWAYYIRANSTWRIAQGIAEKARLEKDPKERARLAQLADDTAYSTKEDYERALKSGPTAGLPHHPSSWNYDMTTNAATRAAGLGPKAPKIKLVLGAGGKKNKGSGKDKGQGPKGSGSVDIEIEGPPNEGKPKSGVYRPG